MRHIRFRTVLAFAAAVGGAPALVVAQADRPATHTVKKGDTLWDLAQQYLGDPFQWPQIYQLNSELIKDPHWIYPGQVFRIPGGTAVSEPSPAQAPAGPAPMQGEASRSSMTVFDPRTRAVQRRAAEALLTATARTAVRKGDFDAAPYIWSMGGPAGGELIGTAEALGVGISSRHRPIQMQEDVFVRMPSGTMASAGSHLVTFRLAEQIQGVGQVVVPTGVVEVTAVLDNGKARARLIQKFEDVYAGNAVVAEDSLAMPMNVFPSRVEFGLATRVLWVASSPQLASVGSRLILAAGSEQGLVPGDQVSLRLPPSGDASATDEEIAIAQVVRVTKWGATARVLTARDAGIRVGTRAQVSAKMP